MGKLTEAHKDLNTLGVEVLNSTFVLLFNICGLTDICTTNPLLLQAPTCWC